MVVSREEREKKLAAAGVVRSARPCGERSDTMCGEGDSID